MRDIAELRNVGIAIYIIQEIGGSQDETFNLFSKFKKTTDRACAKLNSPSQVMYVGSSITGVESRIRQHIGDGPKKTYALHLKHWFKGEFEITIKSYNEPLEVLQIIEDDLSDRLKPAFGKLGGNGR
jgi:Uri superfamily endonuclease